MNAQTKFVMAIYEMTVIIRDTLEYFLPDHQSLLNSYSQRGLVIQHLLDENSPISSFCQNNKEAGDKIIRQTKEFYEDVYGKTPTMMRIENGNVIFDKANSVQLFDYIVGLHETYLDICRGFIGAFKEQNTLEEELVDLLDKHERSYRSLASLCLGITINEKFIEFNKVMNDNKGKSDVSTSFISNEMSKLVGFLNFIVTHNTIEEYKPKLARLIELVGYYSNTQKMVGEMTVDNVMHLIHDLFITEVNETRASWAVIFQKMFEDLRVFEIEERKAAEGK